MQNSGSVAEENRRWLTCTTNKMHDAEKLMLTSIIPGDALRIAGDLIHHVRRKHGIRSNCPCTAKEKEQMSSDTQLNNGVSQVS